jgi:hypothetical protein
MYLMPVDAQHQQAAACGHALDASQKGQTVDDRICSVWPLLLLAGCALVEDNATLIVHHSLLHNNTVGNSSTAFGAAVTVQGHSTLHVHNTTFTNNTVIGSKLACCAAICGRANSTVRVTASQILNGTVLTMYGGGAGVGFRDDAVAFMEDTVLADNKVFGAGMTGGDAVAGGAAISGSGLSHAELNRCQLLNNLAKGSGTAGYAGGGGAAIRDNATMTVRDSLIADNHGTHSDLSSFAAGGGVALLNDSYCMVYNTTVRNNSVNGYFAFGGGLLASLRSRLVVIDSLLDANWALSEVVSPQFSAPTHGQAVGGGISTSDNATVQVLRTIIRNNNAVRKASGMASGGGVYAAANASVTVMSSWIGGNSITGNQGRGGGGLAADEASKWHVVNSSLVDNRVTCRTGALAGGALVAGTARMVLADSVVEGNRVAPAGGGSDGAGEQQTQARGSMPSTAQLGSAHLLRDVTLCFAGACLVALAGLHGCAASMHAVVTSACFSSAVSIDTDTLHATAALQVVALGLKRWPSWRSLAAPSPTTQPVG